MNLDQLDRYLLYRLDAIQQAGTIVSAQWSPDERRRALNNGYQEVAKLIRRQRKDHLTRTMLSTDASALILGRTYDPVSLRLVAGTAAYTLPPDFLEMRSIRVTTIDREHYRFELRDPNHTDFLDARRFVSRAGDTFSLFFGAITGERTITIAPTPQETLDIEIVYVRMLEPLVRYTTGSCHVLNGSTTVTPAGSAAVWSFANARIVAGDELLVGTTTAVPTPDLDASTRYHKIETTAAASLGLSDAYLGASLYGALYILSSVPQFHQDWHFAIATYAIWELLSKHIEEGSAEAVQAASQEWQTVAAALVPEAAQRQTSDVETVEDWEP